MHLYAEHVLDDIYPVHLLDKLERETLEVTLFYKWDKEVFFGVCYEINLEKIKIKIKINK
jgi:hypothetical protein